MSERDWTQPQNLVEKAGDAGIQAIHEYLAHADAKVEKLIILLTIDKSPGEEPDTVTCGTNIEDARDLVATLAAHLIEAGNQIGLSVQLLPMLTPPPQG